MAAQNRGGWMAEPIGELLREWRTKRGLSLGALAQQTALNKSTLSRWESGKVAPRLHEIERVLGAIDVSSEQRKQVLSALESPRAVQTLAKEGDSPPVAGDLLRAMRLRRGMTQAQAAERAGVAQSMVARWERSDDRPTDEHLHSLCWALGAHPDELAALLCGRFLSPSPLKAPFDNDALNARLAAAALLKRSPSSAPLADLAYLSIEAELWSLALQDSHAADALTGLYSGNAVRLYNRNRRSEATFYTRRALKRGRGDWAKQEIWVHALMARIMLLSEGNHAQAREAVRLAASAAPHINDSAYRAWLYGEAGAAFLALGDFDRAYAMGVQGVQEGEAAGEPMDVHHRRVDYAKILIAAGNVRLLERLVAAHYADFAAPADPYETSGAVVIVRACLALGDVSGAERERNRLDAHLLSLSAKHLAPQWDAIFPKF